MPESPISRETLEKKGIQELIKLISDPLRMQKARALNYTDIRTIFQSEEGYMYEIRGKKQTYFLRIDRKNKALIHNCEDWIHRCVRDYKLCKHFIRIFQSIYENEAKEILIDLILQPWAFFETDDYIKKL